MACCLSCLAEWPTLDPGSAATAGHTKNNFDSTQRLQLQSLLLTDISRCRQVGYHTQSQDDRLVSKKLKHCGRKVRKCSAGARCQSVVMQSLEPCRCTRHFLTCTTACCLCFMARLTQWFPSLSITLSDFTPPQATSCSSSWTRPSAAPHNIIHQVKTARSVRQPPARGGSLQAAQVPSCALPLLPAGDHLLLTMLPPVCCKQSQQTHRRSHATRSTDQQMYVSSPA